MNLFGWLTILGAVAASVGFTVYGMGTSTLIPDPLLLNVGKYLMAGGLLALIVGYVAYRATERSRSS